ncbi:MAG: MFS transporter [Betaproteobacteria bacterium]
MTSPALAPFRVRSFRFQWPADLATSCAFEMETLILGWYILTATGSVGQLAVFGALQWMGALVSPLFGAAGDRIGMRAMLCITRGIYATLAALLTLLILAGALAPWHVFVISGVAGMIRPSDQAMRSVLVAQTMRPDVLLGALGLSRTTTDGAKVAGALAGAGGVALVGMASAYVAVTALYVFAFLLSLGVARPGRLAAAGPATKTLRGLRDAVSYVWGRPELLGAFTIAFLANLLAYPFVLALLPYVAKEVYGVGQAGLGHFAAMFAVGALAGSLIVGAVRVPLAAGRAMIVNGAAWFLVVVLFGQTQSATVGLALLFLAGLFQSLSLVPLGAVMLRTSSDEMRGRVMGMRVLAVWGLPLGILAAGPVIAHVGFPAASALYGGLGLAATLAIAWRLRAALWRRGAAANALP